MKKNAKGFAKEIRPNFFMDAALLFIFNTSRHALHERPHGFFQIWIAIAVYVLVAIVKKQLHLDLSLYTILQILSVTLFEKTPILEALSIIQPQESKGVPCNQLTLFD